MAEWAQKRFWKTVDVSTNEDGFGIVLDGRPVRTPGKSVLQVPTRSLAEAIAAEWDAQTETIDPISMPSTRAANSAIEKVTPQRAEVVAHLAEYGQSDLLCYRAEAPADLAARQAAAWDPMLDWAEQTFGARLITTAGVMFQEQPRSAVAALGAELDRSDVWQLTALSDLIGLSGSLVLGLAARDPAFDRTALWGLSRVDETYQQEQWGTDEEADEQASIKQAAFLHAGSFFDLLAQ